MELSSAAAGISARLTDTGRAVVFSAVVLALATAAGLLIRELSVPSGPAFVVWGATPVLAVLVLMFVVTRDGFTRAGWSLLGLHRLGVRLWWIAVVVTLSTSVFATAAVVAIGFATVTLPAGLADAVINFAINLVIVTLTFALAEEVGFRGYLLPRLSALSRNRALAVTGLVHAAWHLPLIFLTPLYHSDGSMLIVLPLFVGTIVAAGFFCGDLRLATGSVWPASIAHAVHNVAWGLLAGFTVASAPVLVEEYLAGDNGVFILLTTVVAAVWLRWWLRRRAAGSEQA